MLGRFGCVSADFLVNTKKLCKKSAPADPIWYSYRAVFYNGFNISRSRGTISQLLNNDGDNPLGSKQGDRTLCLDKQGRDPLLFDKHGHGTL